MTVPDKCVDIINVVAHQHLIYREIASTLLKLPESVGNARHTTFYVSLAAYMGDVMRAFVREVSQEVPKDITAKWRSSYLDFHIALALNDNAFTTEHQRSALKKMNRTWNHFKLKRTYRKVQTRESFVSICSIRFVSLYMAYSYTRKVTQIILLRWRQYVRWSVRAQEEHRRHDRRSARKYRTSEAQAATRGRTATCI